MLAAMERNIALLIILFASIGTAVPLGHYMHFSIFYQTLFSEKQSIALLQVLIDSLNIPAHYFVMDIDTRKQLVHVILGQQSNNLKELDSCS